MTSNTIYLMEWLSYGFTLGGNVNGGLVCLIATYLVGNLSYYIATSRDAMYMMTDVISETEMIFYGHWNDRYNLGGINENSHHSLSWNNWFNIATLHS